MLAINTPGFGWTNISNGNSPTVIDGKYLIEGENLWVYPALFLSSNIPGLHISPEDFDLKYNDLLNKYFSRRERGEQERQELFSAGQSEGRPLKWSIMSLFPNSSFKLHAHANLEVVYVIRGQIHEYRYQVHLGVLLR